MMFQKCFAAAGEASRPPAGRHILAAALTAVLAAAASLEAQSLRADAIASEQAAKAEHLQPYQPTRIERLMGGTITGLFEPPIGLYPFVGPIYSGGGPAVGPALRLPYADTGMLTGEAAFSVRRFKLARMSAGLPAFAGDHVQVVAHAQVIDAPGVAFFGVGPESVRDARSRFGYRPLEGGVTAMIGAAGLTAGGGLDLLSIRTGEGTIGRGPSIETLFTETSAPGLGLDPSYRVARAFAELDWRESPGYTTRGGRYRIDWGDYRERRGLPYEFRRVDIDVSQFVPLVRANWVIALRAAASMTSTTAGHEVPFFLMPSLGSGSALRGFDTFRFRDRHALSMTAEYRWRPSRFLDMAVFSDLGRVAPRLEDLGLKGLERTYGIAARFHAPEATVLRFELARSPEGLRFIAATGPVF